MRASRIFIIAVIAYLIINLGIYAYSANRATLKALHFHNTVLVPYVLFSTFSITASLVALGIYFIYRNSLMRNALKSKVAFGALVIIFAYYTWSIFEGLLQYASHQILYFSLAYKFLPYNPFQFNFTASLLPPSIHHPFGTNYNGEDILSRVLYAAPSDAEISTVVVISAIIIGGLVGMFAGYFGGWVDEVLMRITDVFLAIPGLILVIAVAVLLGSSFTSAMIGLMIPWWATYARLFRSQTLVVKNMGYVDMAKLMGFRSFRIIFKHVFHNVIDPILSYAALDFGNVILTYASLTFLGIGLQGVNQPEWGAMVSDGLQYLPHVWWWSLFPSIVILVLVASFVILGDRLQDVIAGRVTY
ncbi:ABC transporter permease [Sulfurisphaera ohwakuensis]|uniref:ABC transporter permease n=1 Tax=Sulfurisphaera ohwakuensis TaxID=69656 RepID=UPI0036F26F43